MYDDDFHRPILADVVGPAARPTASPVTTLLIATSGGHLKQLHALRPRLVGIDDDVVWVTLDTAQSRSLLDGEEVFHARLQRPRDLTATITNTRLARSLLRRHRVNNAVSTGASLAVPFFTMARAHGARCHYIESATRVEAPSLSGRIVGLLPGVHLYTQNASWAGRRWRYRGSIFDGFAAHDHPVDGLRRVVVTLGSSESFGFRRLVERLVALLPSGVEVTWQTGETDVSGLGIESRPWMPAHELERAMQEADVVICHAGTGSSLSCLEAGKMPVLAARRRAYREHVDDHQSQIATDLAARGLALVRQPEELSLSDLAFAAAHRITRLETPPPLLLDS